ncbi:MAG: hypothetical protein INQ03_13230 [Candidatus Heimdallarchaeota archaeon]|nr:hypothetical protein [Candidatus Heimdallarchaeota archaeon]
MNTKHQAILICTIGTILVLISPKRDTAANLSILSAYILILFIHLGEEFSERKSLEFPKMAALIIRILLSIIIIVGLMISHMQAPAWLSFLPFLYYFLISGISLGQVYAESKLMLQ